MKYDRLTEKPNVTPDIVDEGGELDFLYQLFFKDGNIYTGNTQGNILKGKKVIAWD